MTGRSASPALRTDGLVKRFGRTVALDGVNLEVPRGIVFGLIGPNGAGKTTIMRALLDIIRPTAGTVRVLDEDPRAGGPPLRRRIGFLPGELRLDGRYPGSAFLQHHERISGPVAPGTVGELAERLGLELARPVRSLSKGNKQKLGLVQAFMHRPELLVLDEPTSGLDPIVQQEFHLLVREACERGQTVFLSSHVLSEIQQTADSVAILRAGRIVSVSDVDALRQSAVRRVRAVLRGASAAVISNALSTVPHVRDATASDGDGGHVALSATVEGDIDPFVKALAAFTVAELVVEEPNLEESVLRLYGIEDVNDVD